MRNKRLFVAVTAAAALVAGILVLAIMGPREADRRSSLAVGGHNTMLSVVLEVAARKGFFAEAGVDVTITPVRSSKESMAAMEAGELDIAVGSLSAGSINMASKGDLRIIADAARLIPSLIVRKDLWEEGRIRGLIDLRGRTIRTPREGSISYYATSRILRGIGLGIDDVVMKYLKEREGVAALEAKNIEVAVLNEPYATLAVQKGVGVRYPPEEVRKFFPENGQQHMVLFTTREMLKRRDVLLAFCAGYVKAASYYDQARRGMQPQREEVVRIVTEYTGATPEVVENSLWPYCSPDGSVDVDYIREVQRYFKESGLIERELDLAKVVNLQYLPK